MRNRPIRHDPPRAASHPAAGWMIVGCIAAGLTLFALQITSTFRKPRAPARNHSLSNAGNQLQQDYTLIRAQIDEQLRFLNTQASPPVPPSSPVLDTLAEKINTTTTTTTTTTSTPSTTDATINP